MGRHGTARLCVVLVVVAGCEGAVSPEPVEGRYALRSINGDDLPCPLPPGSTGFIGEILGGMLALYEDGTFVLTVSSGGTGVWSPPPSVDTVSSGTYALAGTETVSFADAGGASFEGTLEGGGWLTVVIGFDIGLGPDPASLRFQRSGGQVPSPALLRQSVSQFLTQTTLPCAPAPRENMRKCWSSGATSKAV